MWGLRFKIAIVPIQDDDTSCQYYDCVFHILNLQLNQGPQYVYYHVQPLFQEHEGCTKCQNNALTI
jgi:hypothetical protein